jgi:hypothetical protein
MIQVHWFGSLGSALSGGAKPPVSLSVSGPTPLTEILERLDIPKSLVQLVMVNHRAVPGETMIHPNDRVALFPREYPFFVDWKDFRLP